MKHMLKTIFFFLMFCLFTFITIFQLIHFAKKYIPESNRSYKCFEVKK